MSDVYQPSVYLDEHPLGFRAFPRGSNNQDVEHWQDDLTGTAKDLGEVWCLEKNGHTVRCVLQGHPIGIEARVLIDEEIHRTQAFRGRKDSREMINATWEWRKAFEEKGWTKATP